MSGDMTLLDLTIGLSIEGDLTTGVGETIGVGETTISTEMDFTEILGLTTTHTDTTVTVITDIHTKAIGTEEMAGTLAPETKEEGVTHTTEEEPQM